MSAYEICLTQPADLAEVEALYAAAIAQQKARGHHVWDAVDVAALKHEIETTGHYSLRAGDRIAAVFAMGDADPLIWGEREQGDALYLHRIAMLPEFSGQGLFRAITDYTAAVAKARGRNRLRMDTWAVNRKIITYYVSRGFAEVAEVFTPAHPDLPQQNHNLQVMLLEMRL
jgi:GNAT superfamily N-acetyltransferase